MELNEIYQGDTLELIHSIESNSIDLIVCDGPYGVTTNEWDKVTDIQTFNLNLIKLFSRVLKPGGALYLSARTTALTSLTTDHI